jgi:hypothetical protein
LTLYSDIASTENTQHLAVVPVQLVCNKNLVLEYNIKGEVYVVPNCMLIKRVRCVVFKNGFETVLKLLL